MTEPGNNWSFQPHSLNQQELNRLLLKGDNMWMEIILAFCFSGYGPILFFRARSLKKKIEEAGAPVPSPVNIAIVVGVIFSAMFFCALLLLLGIILLGVILELTEKPTVWVSHSSERQVTVTVDHQTKGQASWEHPLRIQVEPGEHRICIRDAPNEPVCTTKNIDQRQKILWNPGGASRFSKVVTHYAINPSSLENIDDDVSFLPRAEWHRMDEYDFCFRDPPNEVQMSGFARHDTRTWIRQVTSNPVKIHFDNGTQSNLDLFVDHQLLYTVPANTWVSRYVREGQRHIMVKNGNNTLINFNHNFEDFGTYVVDCTAGQARYVRQTLNKQNTVILEIPVPPNTLHNVSGLEKVFGRQALRASWSVPPSGNFQVFSIAPTTTR